MAALKVSASAFLSVSKLWTIDRYARFIAPDLPVAATEKTSRGKWQTYNRQEHPDLKLSLIESNHLMITNGQHILESILLWQSSQNWIKAVVKGDSILFLYKQGAHNRRFRIKMGAVPPPTQLSPVEVCNEVVRILNPLLPIEVMSESQHGPSANTGSLSLATGSSQTGLGLTGSVVEEATTRELAQLDQLTGLHQSQYPQGSGQCLSDGRNQQSNHIDRNDQNTSIDAIGQELLSSPHPPSNWPLPLGQAYVHAHFPTQQLSSFIRLCLSDPEFVDFVEAVEKELSQF